MRKLMATLGALSLGTALTLACAPPPDDKGGGPSPARTGGSTGSSGGSTGSSGGSSGSTGGSTGSSGGSTGASGGSSGSTGGASGSTGGSSGSTGGSSGSTGGASGSTGGASGSTGGSSGGTGGAAGGGGGTDTMTPPAAGATFTEVYGIIMMKCLPCHNAGKGAGTIMIGALNTKAAAYTSIMAKAVKAGDPAGSVLFQQVSGTPPKMPKGMAPLTAPQVDKIKAWIMAGAKND